MQTIQTNRKVITMILNKPNQLYGIAEQLYQALKCQKPETEIVVIFEKEDAQMKTVIFKDDEVQLSKTILTKKNTENDFEIIDVCYFTRIEVLTVGELF